MRLLDGYRGYVITDDDAGFNSLAAQDGLERLCCWTQARRNFVEAHPVQPKGNTGRAEIALNLINKLCGVERYLKDSDDEGGKVDRLERSLSLLT